MDYKIPFTSFIEINIDFAKVYASIRETLLNSGLSDKELTDDDFQALFKCVKQGINDIKWDKIFVLPPTEGFVDDGCRYMGQSSMDERRANFDKLMLFFQVFGLMDKVEVLYSDFSNNFEHVKQYIQSLYV